MTAIDLRMYVCNTVHIYTRSANMLTKIATKIFILWISLRINWWKLQGMMVVNETVKIWLVSIKRYEAVANIIGGVNSQ